MNSVLRTIERKVEQGEVDHEDVQECAEAVMELREEYPEAWSICSIANDEVLNVVTENE